MRRSCCLCAVATSLVLVVVVDAFVAPRIPTTTTLPRPSASSSPTGGVALHYTKPVDLDISFGSDESAGVSWGDDSADHQDANERAQRVQELLQEADQDFYQQRKNLKWGKFANVTKATDLQSVLEQERAAIAAENERKAQLAAASGIAMQVLEPKESLDSSRNSVFEENGNVQIASGSKSWFAEMDEDIQNEWKSLMQGRNGASDDDSNASDGSSDDDDDNTVLNNTAFDVTMDDSTGKMVARDALAGVRVGSAGGWTLEVFPGDFVVHRKFGIGRFERTCLRPKTKLTPEERKARDDRRAEILTEELRKRKRVTPDQIQEIRSKFGTDEDTDIISNPQTTVLEISYADAVVHVPVDRAYRLSRYRAGDAVVKPKLSRVRGNAWAKAKRQVEENTIQLAQDVLALYTTRETLQRKPFDPSKEDMVKEFEKTFPFEPTPDQVKCFEDCENDMVWRSRPMDRLVCGKWMNSVATNMNCQTHILLTTVCTR
eukprot:scaffold162_cov176-Amphora_coffeaeformis.AAC.6